MPARLRADRTSSGLDRAGTNGMRLCAHSITPPQPIVMVADVPHHLRLVPQELRESVIRPVSLWFSFAWICTFSHDVCDHVLSGTPCDRMELQFSSFLDVVITP